MPEAWDALLTGWPAWLGVTLLLGCPAAYASGRALARHWHSFLPGLAYAALLAAAVDFLAYALFDVSVIPAWDIAARVSEGDIAGTALSLCGWAATCAVLLAAGFAGWRITRTGQMRRQYPFLLGN
jgi:hypothetical protein